MQIKAKHFSKKLGIKSSAAAKYKKFPFDKLIALFCVLIQPMFLVFLKNLIFLLDFMMLFIIFTLLSVEQSSIIIIS